MKLMERLYDNIEQAKAFQVSFTNFVYFYDDVLMSDFETVICDKCMKSVQTRDYLVPRGNCRKPTGILHSLDMGVSPELRDDLIARFEITEEDFRPVYSKKGALVYYQITPRHVMLPIGKENEWSISSTCPYCGGVQHYMCNFTNEKKEPYYLISQEALDDMCDLNITYERCRFYRPMIIISRRVFEYLTDKYPRTHYFPLYLK